MIRKILIPLHDGEIAPRFDLATEIQMVSCTSQGDIEEEKVLILPGPSAERICHMAMTEQVHTILCGGIDQEVYDYLTWKKVEVIDDLIGTGTHMLQRYLSGRLQRGDIIRDS